MRPRAEVPAWVGWLSFYAAMLLLSMIDWVTP